MVIAWLLFPSDARSTPTNISVSFNSYFKIEYLWLPSRLNPLLEEPPRQMSSLCIWFNFRTLSISRMLRFCFNFDLHISWNGKIPLIGIERKHVVDDIISKSCFFLTHSSETSICLATKSPLAFVYCTRATNFFSARTNLTPVTSILLSKR